MGKIKQIYYLAIQCMFAVLFNPLPALKETGSWDRLKFFWQKSLVLGLNTNLYWFLNFKDVLLMSYCIFFLPFSQRLRRIHIGEIIFIGDFFWNTVHCMYHSPIMLCYHLHCNIFLWTGKTYSSAAQKCLNFSAALK